MDNYVYDYDDCYDMFSYFDLIESDGTCPGVIVLETGETKERCKNCSYYKKKEVKDEIVR